jgi:hypothetical protein
MGSAPTVAFSKVTPLELQGEGAPPISVTHNFAGFVTFSTCLAPSPPSTPLCLLVTPPVAVTVVLVQPCCVSTWTHPPRSN